MAVTDSVIITTIATIVGSNSTCNMKWIEREANILPVNQKQKSM